MSVYFITCREVDAVKIGYSGDPHGRLPEIQTGCPLPLTLEAMTPGTKEHERQLHQRFADDRLHGEWFRLTDIIEAMMKECGEVPPPPTVIIRDEGRRERREAKRNQRVMARMYPAFYA
jgi:hypothetical protein